MGEDGLDQDPSTDGKRHLLLNLFRGCVASRGGLFGVHGLVINYLTCAQARRTGTERLRAPGCGSMNARTELPTV